MVAAIWSSDDRPGLRPTIRQSRQSPSRETPHRPARNSTVASRPPETMTRCIRTSVTPAGPGIKGWTSDKTTLVMISWGSSTPDSGCTALSTPHRIDGSTAGNRGTSTTGGLGLSVPSVGKHSDLRNLPLSSCRIQPAGQRGAGPRLEAPGQPERLRREPLAKWQSPDQQSASKASKGVTAPPNIANGRPRNGKVGPVGQEAGWVGPLRESLPGPMRRCLRPEEFSC
jgi:hypothetical protein